MVREIITMASDKKNKRDVGKIPHLPKGEVHFQKKMTN